MHSILEIKSKISDYKLSFVDTIQEIEHHIDQPNTITFIDDNVNKLYPSLQRDTNIVLPSSEAIKSYTGTAKVLQNLTERRANIQTKLVVIGGGILQDLVGFCASVYCRGIQYTLIPTTLLAQADSCVGGKTSINFVDRKNIIGTFYPPTDIIVYPKFTQTLSKLDYTSGLGEIYKFHILQNKILDFDSTSSIEYMIHDGLKYKIDILSRDEFDKGERKFLNFGHTFGHALESTSENIIPHGIAVIIGSMIAVMVSKELGYNVSNYDSIIEKGTSLIKSNNLSFKQEWFNLDLLLEIIKSDKKSTGKLTMVLIDDKPFLENIEDISILQKVLKQIYEII
jgi:3-dehydroquinate synthase